jgi:hypothetical protein
MKIIVFFFSLMIVDCLALEFDKSEFQGLDKIINSLQETKSVRFKALHEKKYHVEFKKQSENEVLNFRYADHLFYCAFYDLKGVAETIFSFDGTNRYHFNSEDQRLDIHKGDASHFYRLTDNDPFLLPYTFLVTKGERRGAFLRLSDLVRESQWEKLKDRIIKNKNVETMQVITVDGGYDENVQSKINYEIFFDTKNDFRISSWIMRDSKNEKISSVFLDQFFTVNSKWSVPQKVTHIFHGGGFMKSVEEGRSVSVYTMSEIAVNANNEEDYAVDPVMAKLIYDGESKKIITISH